MVTTEERVLRMLVEANPVPDIGELDALDDGTSYLAILEHRSSRMTRTETKPPETSKRRAPAAIGVAAALALVVGAAIVLTSNVAGGIAAVEGFAEAVSSGSTDLSDYVTDDATFGPMTAPLDDDLAAFWAGLDTTLSVSGCEQTEGVVRCEYQWTDRIREVQDRPEFGTMTFLIEGSRIGSVARVWDQEASRWIEFGSGLADPTLDYIRWLDETHPGWLSELDWIGEPVSPGGSSAFAPLAHDDPVRNARYAEVLTRYLDQYAQHLESIGGLPG